MSNFEKYTSIMQQPIQQQPMQQLIDKKNFSTIKQQIDIDKCIKNFFKISDEEVLIFKDFLKANNILLSFVLNKVKNNFEDLDIYIHKNKLNIFLAYFKFKNCYPYASFLTLEDELYFNENKILQKILFSINKTRINILVVDNHHLLREIIPKFLFSIMIGYYNEKIYENKNIESICLIDNKYLYGYKNRYIDFVKTKGRNYEDFYNEINFIIISDDNEITIKNEEEYIIKFILNYIFDIYKSNFYYIKKDHSDYILYGNIQSNIYIYNLINNTYKKIYLLNLFNKYNYIELIKKLTYLLNDKIDILRLIFNTIKIILFDIYEISINQLKFDIITATMKVDRNIFIKFIIKYKLFTFDHYDYIDLIEYKFNEIIKKYMILNKLIINNDIKITKKKLDIKDGYDMFDVEYKNIKEYIKENKNNIVLVLNDKNITLITKEALDELISNINDNWFFICDSNDPEKVFKTPYIKIPLSGVTIYVNYNDLYKLFISTAQIFFLNKIENIEKSATFKNTAVGQKMGIADYVSANHCQDGSNLGIYEISELQPEIKARSMKSLSLSHKSQTLRTPKVKSSYFSERKAKLSTKK